MDEDDDEVMRELLVVRDEEVLADAEGLDVGARELEVDDDSVTDWYISILRLPPQYSVAFDLQVNVQPSALATASVARELPQ